MDGLPFTVNGQLRKLVALSVFADNHGKLPVWTAIVDSSLGCAGSFEDALLMAARAADEGVSQGIGDKP